MKFLHDDFLLTTPSAKQLYHDYAKHQPIIDYHCHLDPSEIYEDQQFTNLTQAWLGGDHYKWRLMRACGVDEALITGDAPDYDKFLAWCQTVPRIIGNPLYSWTHLELKRFFNIDLAVNEANAPAIWEAANAQLATKAFSRRNLIVNSQVKIVCTTDDPADDLAYHQALAKEEDRFRVLPTFRPDKALNIDQASFLPFLERLGQAVTYTIESYQDLLKALRSRMEFFHSVGCRLSDHGIDVLHYQVSDEALAGQIFAKALQGQDLSFEEIHTYRTTTLSWLLKQYHDLNWTCQLHLHAYRNCNSRMFQNLGPDTGYDGINDLSLTSHLQLLLDQADKEDRLPRTILYSLNENDLMSLAVLMGSYQKDYRNKLQLGSGWWYVDTRSGMRKQLTAFANASALHNFVGMLTDSRSFLSYTRHEYFRRVLCEWLGELVERGEGPDDLSLLGKLVEDIAYQNANSYFNF